MEAYREIMAGSKLAEIIDLPDELRTSEVEVIVLPVKEKDEQEKKNKTFNWDDLPKHDLGKVRFPLDRDSIYSNER
jgi:hypothetical protein